MTNRPSQRPPAAALLASPPFLAAVALLLLNDHVLKAAYGTWMTGKLSDFAGVFAFALFWTALLPHRRDAIFALTAATFVLWKTPLADPALAAWNALGVFRLARVVDYTDWIALLVLVPAHQLARRHAGSTRPAPRPRPLRRFAAVGGATAAVLAFTATSVAPRLVPIPEHAPYAVPASRSEVLTGLQELEIVPEMVPERAWSALRLPEPVLLHLELRQPPERRVYLNAELHETESGTSTIRLVDARAIGPHPSSEGLHRAYTAQVHAPLLAWLRATRDTAPR